MVQTKAITKEVIEMLRDRIMKALRPETPEKIKLNMDIGLMDVVSVTWYPITRNVDVHSERPSRGETWSDLETINGVYKIICDDMHQSVWCYAFAAKEREDPKVVFKFFEPRNGGFDESKGTLWID